LLLDCSSLRACMRKDPSRCGELDVTARLDRRHDLVRRIALRRQTVGSSIKAVASGSTTRRSVFVSYSHKDRAWLERLQVHTRPLVRDGNVDWWDDTMLEPGSDWRAEIERALTSARVAVLLVSAHFLASEFVADDELPRLLKRARDDGTTIIPLILSPCRFARMPSLARFQSVNPPDQPLSRLEPWEQDDFLDRTAGAIERALATESTETAIASPLTPPEPEDPVQETGSDAAEVKRAPAGNQQPGEGAPDIRFLVAAWIEPLARLFGGRWLAAMDLADAPLIARLSGMVEAASDPNADAQIRRTAVPEADLIAYLREHSSAVDKLWQEVRYPRVAEEGKDRAARRVGGFHTLLTFTFDRVAWLDRPVALPGFFNCVACVAVIDARPGEALTLEPPGRPESGSDLVWLGDEFALEVGMPRVWILRADSLASRDTVVSELNRSFSRPRRVPSEVILGTELSQRGGERVVSVSADRIQIMRPLERSSEGTIAERVLNSLKKDPVADDEFYDIEGPDGLRPFTDELRRVLMQAWTHDQDWP